MRDVIIIGSGPAGASAAIYAARAGLDTLIISENGGAMLKSEKIENYYGFVNPISGTQLVADGIRQAERLGVGIVADQVVNISFDDIFTVTAKTDEHQARSVILATGSNRTAPRIKGFSEFEGKGISYCALCDGMFFRKKEVAVLGCCEYALHEAMDLLPIVKKVTLITNGAAPIDGIPESIGILTQEIAAFEGGEYLEGVRFKDGSLLPAAGVFVAIGVAGSSDLARKLGAQTEGKRIVVDDNMATNVPGLYAAGDCTGGMMQVVKAAYEGAKAGIAVIKYVREKRLITAK